MKSKTVRLATAAAVLLLAADSAQAYRRYYGRGSGGYGYGGGYGSTVFGSYLGGMAAYTRAAGQYNLTSSMAAVNYQQAYTQWLGNRKLKEQTYFDMRRMNASYRAEQEMMHPHATQDQLIEFAKKRAPTRLSANDFDPPHGVINWPPVLKGKDFDDNRHELEGLFATAAADPSDAGLGTQNCRDIQRAVTQLSDKLHSKIKDYSPDEYIPASKFLKSLGYEARFPADSVAAK
jgi:hypothetical protein